MTTARRLRLSDRAFTLELCVCGLHPRIMHVRALIDAWSHRPEKLRAVK